MTTSRPAPGDRRRRPRVHDPAIAAAARVRCITSPNPWVGAVVRTADGRMFAGATEEPGRAHAEVVALAGRGRRGPGRHPLRHARAVLPPRPAPGRAPTPSSTPASAGWSWASPTPTRWWRARASTDCGPRASRSTLGVRARQVDGPARALPQAPHAPAAPTSCSSWRPRSTAAPPPPTAPASGSPRRRPAPTATGCGPRATPSSSAPAPSGRDDPSLTVRDYRPPVAARSDARSTPAGSSSAGCRTSARVRPCRELDGDLGDRARRPRGRGRAAAPGRGRRRRWRATSTAPAWSTAT